VAVRTDASAHRTVLVSEGMGFLGLEAVLVSEGMGFLGLEAVL